MRLTDVLDTINAERNARAELEALVETPDTPLDELQKFCKRIRLNGVGVADVLWLNEVYNVTLDTNNFNQVPSFIGYSEVMETVARIEQCLGTTSNY